MTMMTKNKLAVFVLVAAAACGGKNKTDTEEGGDPMIDPNATTGDPTDRSDEQLDPVKMDEVVRLLDRKRMIVSRCLSSAIDSGEAPKGARGKITLAISIAPSGKASSVEVVKTSFESQAVQGCVKEKVQDITFPQFKRQYDTSYTYAMEAN